MKISNCLNCGAALSANGYCAYCGTHNKINREIDFGTGDYIDILLTQKQSDGTISYVPVRGRISSVTVRSDAYSSCFCDGSVLKQVFGPRNVLFEFEGFICDRGD